MVIFLRPNEKARLQATICGSADGLSLWNHSVSIILIFALSYIISFLRTQELLLFKKLFLLLHQDGFDTLFQQKVEPFCVLRNVTGYHIGRQQSTVLSAAFQKTYVTQKAPRSTLPLNLTVSGQSRKAYVERGALFIGSAASRAFGVLWVCRFLW